VVVIGRLDVKARLGTYGGRMREGPRVVSG